MTRSAVHHGSVLRSKAKVPVPLNRDMQDAWFARLRKVARVYKKRGRMAGTKIETAIGVLAALVSFANRRTGLCCPSYETIAKRAGVSRSAAAKALRWAKSAGLIRWCRTCEPTGAELRQTSNIYTFVVMTMAALWGMALPWLPLLPAYHGQPERVTTALEGYGGEAGSFRQRVASLDASGASGTLEAALARLGKSVGGLEP